MLELHTPGSSNNKEPRISGIVNNVSQQVKHYTNFITYNYWTPLASQVEELGLSHEKLAHSYVTSILGDSNCAVFDTGAASSCGRTGDKFQPTTQNSHKIFPRNNGETTAAITQAKIYHNVRDPANTVDMVPQLQHNSLVSGGKFVDTNYITVLILPET